MDNNPDLGDYEDLLPPDEIEDQEANQKNGDAAKK